MFLPAHIVTGLIIGKLTGQYVPSLLAAVLVDVDHVFVYIRHGVFKNFRTFVRTVTSSDDPYGGQRNWLHNVVVWFVISCVLYFSVHSVWLPLSLGYLSHLVLDALDGADYYPLYPWKKLNIRGPVNYFSITELVFTFLLALLFTVL